MEELVTFPSNNPDCRYGARKRLPSCAVVCSSDCDEGDLRSRGGGKYKETRPCHWLGPGPRGKYKVLDIGQEEESSEEDGDKEGDDSDESE